MNFLKVKIVTIVPLKNAGDARRALGEGGAIEIDEKNL